MTVFDFQIETARDTILHCLITGDKLAPKRDGTITTCSALNNCCDCKLHNQCNESERLRWLSSEYMEVADTQKPPDGVNEFRTISSPFSAPTGTSMYEVAQTIERNLETCNTCPAFRLCDTHNRNYGMMHRDCLALILEWVRNEQPKAG